MISAEEFGKRFHAAHLDRTAWLEQRRQNERELRALCTLLDMTVEHDHRNPDALIVTDQGGEPHRLDYTQVAALVKE